jgi:methanogenic corrinoid protein MtbC1
MLESSHVTHPLSEALAGSPHFASTEPVSDIARMDRTGDLYLALARTIEREVIPRILLNNKADLARRDRARLKALARTTRDVPAFCRIVLTGELVEAEEHVANEMAKGATPESMLLDLFAPTARRLGELWESDECTFVDVTLALGRLQQILRIFSDTYRAAPDPAKLGFRALLATVPSNQHVFGIFVVEELFRRSGWNVLTLPAPKRAELTAAVAQEWFAVVGLSISCDDGAKATASLIADIRSASLNKSVLVLVGGRYIADNPEQSSLMGADLAGADAQQAIERSQAFLKSFGR